MKKSVFIFLPLILLLGCSPPRINQDNICPNDAFNKEIFESLKELRSKYLIRMTQLEETVSDRSIPKISDRIRKPSMALRSGCSRFIESCNPALNDSHLTELEKELMIKTAQDFAFDMIGCLIKDTIERHDKLLDSLRFVEIVERILPNYKQTYDTVIIQRISTNFLIAKAQLSEINLNLGMKDRIRVLMAQNKMLRETESIVIELLGCNAAYANTGFDIFAKRIDSLSSADSTTLLIRHTLILDVTAAGIEVEGVPGNGWVSNEYYYYRVRNSDFKDVIHGRLSFKSKSGDIRHKDFQTEVYN